MSSSFSLVDACLYLPLGVLLSVVVIEIFSGGRKGIDLDKAVVVLLVTSSILFFGAAFLTFSQTSALGQQIAVKSAGAGVLLGVVCALAAMLKQQCYLQKLLAAARGRTRRGAPSGGLWPVVYAMMLLVAIGGAVGSAWMRPDLLASGTGLETGDEALVMEEEAAQGGASAEVAANEATPAVSENLFHADPEVAEAVMEPEEASNDEDLPIVETSSPESESGNVPSDEPLPEPVESEVAAVAKVDPNALSTFQGSVMPMMKGRCVDCHGEEKQKGGLRLDTPEWIRKGGNSGPVVVAFQPEKSYLYTSTVLPADDPDIMPAKGKPLTSAQTSALKRWIRGGAPMGDGKDEEAAAAAVASAKPADGGAAQGGASGMSDALASALAEVHIQFKALDGGLFEIDCSLTRNYPDVDLDLSVLSPIAASIHTLDLSKTKIGNAALAPVAEFKELRKLLLSRTTVGDEALAYFSELKNLEVLNLYGTNVSDAGLESLTGLANLKKLYLWNSKATSAGGNRLKKTIPDLEVNVGQ